MENLPFRKITKTRGLRALFLLIKIFWIFKSQPLQLDVPLKTGCRQILHCIVFHVG